ncbi:hypothetical protein [Nocardia acidivorans]|uniref:hypothetical protein n=1 Tax=Nocardia acidivorans TaxID=404580 RepID=UPI00157CB367|nr:hypothetical protein [Nocardia acidivorans]
MLTTYDLDDHAVAAVRASAGGFLLNDVPFRPAVLTRKEYRRQCPASFTPLW